MVRAEVSKTSPAWVRVPYRAPIFEIDMNLKNEKLKRINDILWAQTGKIDPDEGFELVANVDPKRVLQELKEYINSIEITD